MSVNERKTCIGQEFTQKTCRDNSISRTFSSLLPLTLTPTVLGHIPAPFHPRQVSSGSVDHHEWLVSCSACLQEKIKRKPPSGKCGKRLLAPKPSAVVRFLGSDNAEDFTDDSTQIPTLSIRRVLRQTDRQTMWKKNALYAYLSTYEYMVMHSARIFIFPPHTYIYIYIERERH